MPIVDVTGWNKAVEANQDDYGKACVDVAREVMRMLDATPGDFDCDKLINDADDAIDAGGLTGFMAGAVASMVSQVHSRGEEFRRKWNIDTQIHDEGEKANESGGVLNPALVTFETKEESRGTGK